MLLTKGARTLYSLWRAVNRPERAEYEHVVADDDPHAPARSETVLKPFINSSFCEREDMGHWVFPAPPAQRPVRENSVHKSHPNTAYLISYSREQLFIWTSPTSHPKLLREGHRSFCKKVHISRGIGKSEREFRLSNITRAVTTSFSVLYF